MTQSHPTVGLGAARSFLFVPGDQPSKLAKARQSHADVLVADLEDAVAPAQKPSARRSVEQFLAAGAGGPICLVRVNDVSSPFFRDDISCLRELPIDGIVVPKAHPSTLADVDLGDLAVVAMVESAAGVRGAAELASDPRVVRLALGGVDLAAQLGLRARADGLQLLAVRSQLVIDSAVAELPSPVDTPYLHFRDQDGLRAECRLVRELGLGAKACIHPAQIDVVHAAFAPTAEELTWAAAIVERFEQAAGVGQGVFVIDGAMVDAPVVARARGLLALADSARGPAA